MADTVTYYIAYNRSAREYVYNKARIRVQYEMECDHKFDVIPNVDKISIYRDKVTEKMVLEMYTNPGMCLYQYSSTKKWVYDAEKFTTIVGNNNTVYFIPLKSNFSVGVSKKAPQMKDLFETNIHILGCPSKVVRVFERLPQMPKKKISELTEPTNFINFTYQQEEEYGIINVIVDNGYTLSYKVKGSLIGKTITVDTIAEDIIDVNLPISNIE